MNKIKLYKQLTVCCLVLMAAVTMGAFQYTNIYLPHTATVEQIIWNPARNRQSSSLGTGYPDVVHYTPGGAGAEAGPRFTFAGFDDSNPEAMDVNYHCNHQVEDTGTAYLDVHYCMDSADTGNVSLRLDIWILTPDEAANDNDLSLFTSLGTADVTTSWTINPKDGAYKYDYNFFDIDDMVTIHGGEMGQIDVADLAGSYQNDWLVKITRVADATEDTHTGDLLVSRAELHIPSKAELSSYGN